MWFVTNNIDITSVEWAVIMFINLSYGAEIAQFCMEVILKCQNSLTYFVDSRRKQVQNGVARHIIKGSVVPLIPKSKKTVKTH